MSTGPLVSILLPVYNDARYIASAIESIQAQTYRHWELIIVDDGSTDDTRDVVQRHLGDQVRVAVGPHEGVGAAINRAMTLASGDVIALHASDDLSRPHRIEQQVRQLGQAGIDIVTCRPAIIDESGRDIGDDALPIFRRTVFGTAESEMFCQLFYGKNFLCAAAAAFTRDTWRKVGAVHAGLLQLQDFDFWLRAAALDLRFHIAEEHGLSYRWHQNNVSSYRHLRRGARELVHVYRAIRASISREMAASLCRRHASRLGFLVTNETPREVLLTFAYLMHEDADIQQIGHEMLIEAIATDERSQAFTRHTGLGRRDAFAILLDGLAA